MKKYCLALLLAFTAPLFASAATERPDIEELFAVMRVEESMQSVMAQMNQMIPKMMENMAAQGKLSPEALQKTKAMQGKVLALVQEEMSWKKIKPQFVQIYAESLTPEEVNGVTNFYKSPAGQAFLNKQPIIIQKSMAAQQKMMMDLMPKIEALVKSETETAPKPAQ